MLVRSKIRRGFILALIGAAFLPTACLPPKAPSDEDGGSVPPELIQPPAGQLPLGVANPEDLIVEWRALAQDPVRNQLGNRHLEIAAALAAAGPEKLQPIIEVLNDANATPETKVFAVDTLTPQITGANLDALDAMLKTATDGTTRSCATHLIAVIQDDRVEPMLTALASDPERRVSFAAMVGLAQRGDAAMREKLKASYWDEATNDRERARVIALVLEHATAEDSKLLNDALTRADIDMFTLQSIVYHLGRNGTAESVPALESAIEKHDDNTFVTMTRGAITAIQNRTGSGETTQ